MRRLLAVSLLVSGRLGLAQPMLGQQKATLPWQATLPLQKVRVTYLSRNALRRDLIGCYALYYERGRVDASLFDAAPSARLDSMPWRRSASRESSSFGASGGRAFRSMTGLSRAGHPAAWHRPARSPSWRADSLTDSVRLSFIDGFSGPEFVFDAPPGQTNALRGRVFVFSDHGPTVTDRGPARAIRERCPP